MHLFSCLQRFACMLALVACSSLAFAAGVEVQSLDGRRTGLETHLTPGKWNLVMVWTTYCGVCRSQYPTISEFHDKHHEDDAVVLGIALDGYSKARDVARYREKERHSFPSVLGEVDEFVPKYEQTTGDKFTGTPTYLLFDGEGAFRGYLDGPVKLAVLEQAIAP